MTDEQTAVAVRDIHQEIVSELREVKKCLVAYRDKAHILTPFARTDWDDDIFPPFHKISRRVAVISSSEKDGEVYEPEQAKGKLALTKHGLQKLDQLAGIEWLSSTVIWDPKEPLVARGEAEAKIRDLDGSWRNFQDGRTIDLRDGSPEAERLRKTSQNMLDIQRKNIIQLAETKAKNRVRRGILGLQASFTKAELEKPFLVFKLVLNVEQIVARNPVLQTALAMKELNITSELYQQASAAMRGTNEIIDMTTGEIGAADQKQITPPPVAPPIDDKGLHVPEAPATDIAATIVQDGIDPETLARDNRNTQIARIVALYKQKLDKARDDRKPPLTILTEDELDEVEDFLKKLKDHPNFKI
jgi:hypothetical protein